MTREEEQRRAMLAKQITENPLWAEGWEIIHKSLMATWENEPSIGAEGRETVFACVRLSKKFRAHVERVFQTGRMAEEQMKDLLNG